MTFEEMLQQTVRDAVREELARFAHDVPLRNGDASYLSIAKAARIADVAPGTIRAWIRAGRLTSKRAGRVLRVARSELERFMATAPRIPLIIPNEGAKVLEEGYAVRAGDIDVIYCYGFGFPRHRGGPMFYAETVGLPIILDRVKTYRDRYGDYWQPAPLLEHLVAGGRGFYGD